jgi:Dolichyl-phosphate-mannose-protein mannosyltransferase
LRGESTARVLVVVVLVSVTLLGGALLIASLFPTSTLAARLVSATGESRAGAITQDLIAHFGDRLRFAGLCLLALAAGLAVLRGSFDDLARSCLRDLGTMALPAPTRFDIVAVGVTAALALGLRVAFLGQPMRYDEALTFNEFASRPLYYGLSFYPDPNNHLLNTLLMHVAFVGLGNQPWVLRLPALVGGVLLVPATYRLAGSFYGRHAALLGAVLVAASSYLVEYSTNARGYTLQALCFVVLLTLTIVAVRRDSPTALLLAALVAAVGAYALPTMLYGVAVAAMWFGLEARRARLSRIKPGHVAVSGLLLGLVVLVAYLPVILVSGPDKLVANRFVTPLTPNELITELPQSLARTWGFWNRDVPVPITLLLVVGFALGTVAEARKRRVPLGIVAAVVCLGLVLVQRVAPFERVWLFVLPLYFLIAGEGLVHLVAGRGVAVLGCLLGAVLGVSTLTSGSILSSTETGVFPDAEAVAQRLSGWLAADDAVLTTLPASLPELQYYFPRAGLAIDSLVRPPEQARRLYVVAPTDSSPRITGWSNPTQVGRFPGAAVFTLERGQGFDLVTDLVTEEGGDGVENVLGDL